jgi:hypothetical protein
MKKIDQSCALATSFVLAVSLIPARAGEATVEEYHVKGAFLLNFAKFVEWPSASFKSTSDPIAICLLGANPFGPGLAAAAQGAIAGTRPISVRLIQEPQQARQCQIVFVSLAERRRVRAVFEATQGGNVLTVGESEGFVAGGGVIEFQVEGSKVRMEISAAAAKLAGLHISAKLMSLSQSGKR